MKRAISTTLMALAASAGFGALVAGQRPETTAPIRVPTETFKLSNGLTVILSQDKRVPMVAVNLWYYVGPANESKGRTGFAHLFEHVMFEGSKHVPEGAIDTLLEAAGAINNGSTSQDRTNYFETLSADYLPLALWIESDRMGYLLEQFDVRRLTGQQDIVRNERRQSLENRPYGLVEERVHQTLYPKDHPYHAFVIGSHADIQSAKYDDVRDFFGRYYRPNNASLAIVGDIDVAGVRSLVEKYFGTLAAGPPVPKSTNLAPAITSERRVVVTDTVELSRVYLAWLVPPAFEDGDAEAALASRILAEGKSSRLYRELVYRTEIAESVEVQHDQTQLGSSLVFSITAAPKHTADEIERAATRIVEELATSGPTNAEFERAQRSVEMGIIANSESLAGKAERLNLYQYYRGVPDYFEQDLARHRRIDASHVQRFARRYLQRSSRVVVHGIPGRKVLGADIPITPAAEPQAPGGPLNADESWRSEPPAPPAQPVAWKPLPPVRFTLSNGLPVLLAERRGLPVVAIDLVVKGGTSSNPPGRDGLDSFMADMLDEGTKTRTSLQIADDVAQLGTTLEIRSTADATVLGTRALRSVLQPAVEIMADVATRPTFPTREIERVRALRLAGFARERGDPDALATRAMLRSLFGERHPYGTPDEGSAPAVAALTREEIERAWRTRFVPGNATIVASGDVSEGDLRKALESAFGRWAGGRPALRLIEPPSVSATKGRFDVVHQAGAPQTVLRVALVGPPRSTPDYFSLLALQTLFGGLFSSRINDNLREQHGYAYGAGSFFFFWAEPSPFAVFTSVRADVTGPAVSEIFKEIARLSADPVTAAELQRTRDYLVRSLPRKFETNEQTVQALGDIVVHDLDLAWFVSYAERVQAVTPAEVQAVARKYLAPDRLVLIAVGDPEVLQAARKANPTLGAPTPVDVGLQSTARTP